MRLYDIYDVYYIMVICISILTHNYHYIVLYYTILYHDDIYNSTKLGGTLR